MQKLVLAGIVLGLIVVVLGAFTRLVDAGLGCPDWPGCYGHLMWPDTDAEIMAAEAAFPEAPVDTDKTWPEMVHRFVAGSLMLFVLALVVTTSRNEDGRDVRQLARVLFGLILLQAAFGMWTVTLKLWPQVVTAHLLGGFATLSMLWVIYLRLGALPVLRLAQSARNEIRAVRVLALSVVILQVALGGWVTSNYAALACADFPTCYGSYWPDMDFAGGFDLFQSVGPNYLGGLLESEARIAIHWAHRLGAIAVAILIVLLSFRLRAHNTTLSNLLVALLVIQITLGILNVVWTLPLPVATLHNAFGALLLLGVITVNFAPAEPSP